MAGATTIMTKGYAANEALVANRFVKLAGDELVDQADTAGERVLGVGLYDASADEATDGKTIPVAMIGIAWVQADAAITRGNQVMTSADGQAATATSTNIPVGIALGAAGAAGDLVPVLLTPGLPALA